MKLIAIIILGTCLQVSAKGYSQKISFSVKEAPLAAVFETITKQSGYSFFYNADQMAKAPTVTLAVQDTDIQEVLLIIFRNKPLAYEIIDKVIIIKEDSRSAAYNDAISFIDTIGGMRAISGRVITRQGEPLVSANVVNKRTGKGTVTNAKGSFILYDVSLNDILAISYTGFAPQNFRVIEFVSLTVIMEPAINSLDKVVVQGYGQTTQRLATGNISTVTAEEIETHPVINVLQALQGKVPGLEIRASSGYSSAPFKVEIRGRKYLNDQLAPDPLIIIDGVPITVLNFQNASPNGTKGFSQSAASNPIGGYSPLFSIDPDEIETVTVLKDADATAIYGSRGGSGVILITTKKGRPGKTKFNVTYSSGFQKNLKWYDLMNTEQYVRMRNEALKNDNLTPDISNAIDLVKWDTTKFTDWQRYLFGGTGKVTNVQTNVSGGNTNTHYRISIGYETRANITTISGANNRLSFSSNLSHSSANSFFKIDLSNLYSYAQVNAIDLPADGVLMPPNAPAVFTETGDLNYSGWEPAGTLLNSFQGLLRSYEGKTSFLNSRLLLTISPLRGLSFSSSFGFSNFNEGSKFITPIKSQDPRLNPTGSMNDGTTNGTTFIIEPQIVYKALSKIFKSEFLIGSTIQSSSQKALAVSGSGFTDDNLLRSVTNAPVKFGSDGYGQYKYFALFGRINFNFHEKFIVNINGRRDGSSRFGNGKQFGNFWSFGGAWIISSENWFKRLLNVVSFAKLRASYGAVGSDNVIDYGYLTRWTANRINVNPYGSMLAYAPTQHANPDLQWQENRKLEIAGNLNFYKDRFNIEVSWYRDRCGNQLLTTPLPVMTGFQLVSENLPAMVQNSGWEIKSTATILKNDQVSLIFNFNVGANRNKLISFPNIENSSYSNQYIVGKSLSTRNVFHALGVDPSTGEYVFEDIDKDGTVQPPAGIKNLDSYGVDLMPKYFGGSGLDFGLGNLSLNVFFTFARIPFAPKGIYNFSFVPGSFGVANNQSIRALNRWQKEGDVSEFARFKTTALLSDQLFEASDAKFTNGSYLRFQNINLSYSVPSSMLKKFRCNGMNLFVRAENIITISNYDGLDPTAYALGTYPIPFTITLGANMAF